MLCMTLTSGLFGKLGWSAAAGLRQSWELEVLVGHCLLVEWVDLSKGDAKPRESQVHTWQ